MIAPVVIDWPSTTVTYWARVSSSSCLKGTLDKPYSATLHTHLRPAHPVWQLLAVGHVPAALASNHDDMLGAADDGAP